MISKEDIKALSIITCCLYSFDRSCGERCEVYKDCQEYCEGDIPVEMTLSEISDNITKATRRQTTSLTQ